MKEVGGKTHEVRGTVTQGVKNKANIAMENAENDGFHGVDNDV